MPIRTVQKRLSGSDDVERIAVALKDPCIMMYTSGTTANPKGCPITHEHLVRNGINMNREKYLLGPDDRMWDPLPLFHMNAMCVGVLASILVGARVAFVPRFSVSNFWPEVERSGATIASILGSMGAMLANAPDTEAGQRCKGQIHTVRGNPFTEEVKAIWRERFGAKQVGGNGYGLTEAAVITSLAGGEHAAPGSSGKRIPDFDVRIVDDLDREVAAGTSGEIVVRP